MTKPKALPMRKEPPPSRKRALREQMRPGNPRNPTTAAMVQHLHDRITMLAGRLERRTPGGVEAQLALAARELQRRADWLDEVANRIAQRFVDMTNSNARLAGELNSLRQRVEGIYPLVMPKPKPKPASRLRSATTRQKPRRNGAPHEAIKTKETDHG